MNIQQEQESPLNKSEPTVKVQISSYKNGTLYRVCPNPQCESGDKEQELDKFGWRRMDKITNKIRNQSWCKECRAKNKHK